jgi:hypothetical protein
MWCLHAADHPLKAMCSIDVAIKEEKLNKMEKKEGAPFSPSTEKEGFKISPASFTQSQ